MNEIADARSRLVGSGSVGEKAEAEAELSSALWRLLVVVENYPNLKADANFRQLQDDLHELRIVSPPHVRITMKRYGF